jgi:polysaccharide biosynthesis transport protein
VLEAGAFRQELVRFKVDQLRQNELTIRDLMHAVQRRRQVIFWITTTCFVMGVLVCIFSTRRYIAVSTIELQNQNLDGLDRDTIIGTTPISTDSLADTMMIQTQAKVLGSETLALRTISSLRLTTRQSILLKTDFSPLANASSPSPSLVGLQPDLDGVGVPLEAVKVFRKNLTVKPVGGTRLLEVSYADTDPQRAAAVVNEIVRQLAEYNQQIQGEATMRASKELSKELDDLRAQSENLQKRVAAIQRETGTYSIGAIDEDGRQQAYSAVLAQFQRAASTLSDATQNRILKEAVFHVAATGDAELLSGLMGSGVANSTSSGISNSLGAVQSLRLQESLSKAQLDQLKVKFGPGYPKVAELQANITATEQAIHDEVARISKRAENDYAIADRTWNDARLNYQALKEQADNLNSKNIQYMITRQEADESRTLYAGLVKRLTTAGILQGLRSSTISVVDQARPPDRPSKPAIPLYLAAALGFGLFAGTAVAIFLESIDDTIVQASKIEQLRLPLLGVMPKENERTFEPEVFDGSGSRYSDALGIVRSSLIRVSGNGDCKVILVSPASPSESTHRFSANLAASTAQTGKKVLLVEADARDAGWTTAVDCSNGKGLRDALTGGDLTCAVLHSRVPGFYVLPRGAATDGVSLLLESSVMAKLAAKWREDFDIVVINGPSALFLPDAGLLAEWADASVEVATYGVTTETSLKRSYDLLRMHSKGNVVVVLDGVPPKSGAYRDYYGYVGSRGYDQEVLI